MTKGRYLAELWRASISTLKHMFTLNTWKKHCLVFTFMESENIILTQMVVI